MAHKKQTLLDTIQIIADILSSNITNGDLKIFFNKKSVDWEIIVTIASQHLMLPALYCRLQQRELLEVLPEELELYLAELTELNRERNSTLLFEAKNISKLFNEENIDHVFMKGLALLAGNYYTDIGERMIGDIDILVASEHLNLAFDLLVNQGYSQFVEFNYDNKNYRHLPRQISASKLGAVELHDQILKHKHNHLIDKTVFLTSKQIINEIAIPNTENLVLNTILAHQINDEASYYNSLHLKGAYDVLVAGIQNRIDLIERLSNQKYSLQFLTLASIFFPSLSPNVENRRTRFYKFHYINRLNSTTLRRLIRWQKYYRLNTLKRLELIFFNKSYRSHVLKHKILK